LGRAFVTISRNFSVAARTSDVSEYTFDKPAGTVSITPGEVTELLADDEFHNAAKREGLFIYPSYPCEERYLCSNIFEGKHFIACVISPLRRNTAALDSGEEYLYRHFCGYVKEIYLRYADDSYVRRQNDRLHDLISDILFRTSDINAKKAEGILKEYGWEKDHEYTAVKLRFMEGAEWESSALYLCRQLEKEWAHSCALKLDTCIAWVVNFSLSKVQLQEQSFYQSLAYIVCEYICKAGIGKTTGNYLSLRSVYLQAEIALEIGQKRDPDFWCYRFDSYVLDYMMEKLTADFQSDHLCSPELLRLMEYDRLNETEYVKTLHNYILYRYNITLAADKTFVHRTTFIRRLERIKEISAIDLDNEENLLHLLISYKVLSMQDR
jgi:hypothetical protein